MPIYEYQCKACGQQTEIIQKISDPVETVCPHCHQTELERLVSAAGFQLKGTGWYVTDFRNKEKPAVDKQKATPSTEKTTSPPDTKQSEKKQTTQNKAKDTKE